METKKKNKSNNKDRKNQMEEINKFKKELKI